MMMVTSSFYVNPSLLSKLLPPSLPHIDGIVVICVCLLNNLCISSSNSLVYYSTIHSLMACLIQTFLSMAGSMARTAARAAAAATSTTTTAATTSVGTTRQSFVNATRHCLELVRRTDNDAYSATLFAPQSVRMPMMTLRAFHAELAMIPTHQRQAAELRYQWWRNAVMECAMASKQRVPLPPIAHPVVTLLAPVMAQFPIQPQWLLTMIDAKEKAALVNTNAARTVEELFEYADGFTGSLFQSLLEVNGIVDNNEAKHAAYHLGRAVSLCSLLRWVPLHASQKKCYLPTDLLRQVHHFDIDSFFRFRESS
jgi:hypothetical protein